MTTRIPRLLPVLLLASLLGACASGATPGAMVPPVSEATLIAPTSALRGAVAVGPVGGGSETSPLWMSSVSDADFAAALRQSLATHAMLSMGGETFRLEATLLDLERPLAGASMEVTARVAYRLVRVAGGAEVFATEIRSAYTAPFNAAFLGVERLRLANEGAVRDNVQRMLVALVAAERADPAAFARSARPIS